MMNSEIIDLYVKLGNKATEMEVSMKFPEFKAKLAKWHKAGVEVEVSPLDPEYSFLHGFHSNAQYTNCVTVRSVSEATVSYVDQYCFNLFDVKLKFKIERYRFNYGPMRIVLSTDAIKKMNIVLYLQSMEYNRNRMGKLFDISQYPPSFIGWRIGDPLEDDEEPQK